MCLAIGFDGTCTRETDVGMAPHRLNGGAVDIDLLVAVGGDGEPRRQLVGRKVVEFRELRCADITTQTLAVADNLTRAVGADAWDALQERRISGIQVHDSQLLELRGAREGRERVATMHVGAVVPLAQGVVSAELSLIVVAEGSPDGDDGGKALVEFGGHPRHTLEILAAVVASTSVAILQDALGHPRRQPQFHERGGVGGIGVEGERLRSMGQGRGLAVSSDSGCCSVRCRLLSQRIHCHLIQSHAWVGRRAQQPAVDEYTSPHRHTDGEQENEGATIRAAKGHRNLYFAMQKYTY